MADEAGLPPVKEMVEWWMARAENPTTGMEAELKAAKARIKQLEHELKEDRKMADIKRQEEVIKMERYEEVIMMMAKEVKNLQEGKEPELVNQKNKALEEINNQLKETINEKEDVKEKLDKAVKDNEDVTKRINMLKKVVESVTDNIGEKKTKKNKKKIKCREVNKPNGCSWGTKCRFDHGDDQGLVKREDCAYWMEGHCRFAEEVCWNIHNPNKKGSKPKESPVGRQAVFQEGQEVQIVPPSKQKAAEGMDCDGWIEAGSRKNKKKKKTLRQKKEVEENVPRAGYTTLICQKDGDSGTPQFPMDGNPTQTALLQTLAVLLQQAGLGQ